MRKEFPKILEQSRIKGDPSIGIDGVFRVKGPNGLLNIIASDDLDWEHVSVVVSNAPKKVPSWKEMCFVKDLFWDEEEVVMQLHPAKSEYVNNHPSCLHLWKPKDQEIPTPPSIFVGIK